MPTLWPNLTFLAPTDIGGAVMAKKQALKKEFTNLHRATCDIEWCKSNWWATGKLSLKEWIWADAIFRSRVLDLPGVGISLVPVVDMANHAPSATSNARYDADEEGNPILILREDRPGIGVDQEVTISYDICKSAGEMIYSYGFSEGTPFSERKHSIFIDLSIAFDDPLVPAKRVLCSQNRERGIELFYDPGSENKHDDFTSPPWRSDNIWLWAVFQEDGLTADYDASDPDSVPVLSWQGEPIVLEPGQNYGARLREITESHPTLANLFRLRTTYMIIDGIATRKEAIEVAEHALQESDERGTHIELCKYLLADNRAFLTMIADQLECHVSLTVSFQGGTVLVLLFCFKTQSRLLIDSIDSAPTSPTIQKWRLT